MPGFSNQILYADNVDFSGSSTVSNQITSDGQLLIGSSVSPNIRVGTLSSSDGSITFTTGNGTLDLQAVSTPLTFKTDTTNATPSSNQIKFAGGIGITTAGAGNVVTITATGADNTITGDSGGALSPTAGNWNILGSGSTVTSGSGSTLTVSLQNLTNHALLVGAGTSTITKVASGSTGQVLQTNTGADPSWSTATYPSTATGTGTLLRADGTNWVATTSTYPNTNAVSTLLYASSSNVMSALATANNGLLVTSNTGVPSILAGPGTTGQVLQSNAAAAPSFSTASFPSTATSTGTILRADGTNWVATTATYPTTTTVSQILYSSSSNVIGGITTGNDGLLVTSHTGVPSILAGPGTTGNILQSNAAAAPSFSTSTYPSTATGTGTLLRADGTNWVATTSTYPNTNAVSTLLYASSSNVMSALATANDGILITSHTGVPSILAGPGATGKILQSNSILPPSYSTATYPSTATGTGTVLRADGTNIVASTFTIPDTAAQGDILYASASNVWSSLAKDTNSTRVLTNTGSSNNPAWAQVNLTTGVTGTLPVGNGGTGVANPTAHAIYVGNGSSAMTALAVGTTGQVLQGNTGADPSWGSPAASFTWSKITADQTAAVNTGYICNKAGLLTLTMPTTSSIGDIIAFVNINTAAGAKFLAATNVQLNLGNVAATLSTGSIASTALGDVCFLVCTTANTTWYSYAVQGNLTVA